MTYYVYILQSQVDCRFYIGQTGDLNLRFKKHNSGYSNYTAKFRPWNLVWFMKFSTRKEAFGYEQKLKSLKSRVRIVKIITENPCAPGSENPQISDLIDFREST